MFLLFFSVELGQSAHVKIRARRITARSSLAALTPQERECKFSSETEDLKILNEYSKAGCQFECMLEGARARCGCTPWSYPIVPGNIMSYFFQCLNSGFWFNLLMQAFELDYYQFFCP